MSNPAETYEREMVPVVFGPCVQLLLEAAQPQSGERILDVACGTGVVARQLARQFGAECEVAALDLNPAMLTTARSLCEAERLKIDWREGRAEELPFETADFDLVLCQHGLQFVPDRSLAVLEMRRVLRPGGRAVVGVWQDLDAHPFWREMNEALDRHLGIPALAAPFSLGAPEDLQALLLEGGFGDVHVESRTITARFPNPERFAAMEVDVIAAAIPSAQHLDQETREGLAAAIEQDMGPLIRESTREGHVVIPFHMNLGVAR
jgi:SAM-dependent methyltransferase